jgi:hypothetical protein
VDIRDRAVFAGLVALTFITASASMVQLTTEGAMRGRVLALRTAVAMRGIPIGAPLVSRVADGFGPRWALAARFPAPVR